MVSINGYDEDYGETAVGDDTDLEWRFKALGLRIKSVRYVANIFHLHHKRNLRYNISSDNALSRMYERKEKNKYVADTGLKQH